MLQEYRFRESSSSKSPVQVAPLPHAPTGEGRGPKAAGDSSGSIDACGGAMPRMFLSFQRHCSPVLNLSLAAEFQTLNSELRAPHPKTQSHDALEPKS